MNVVLYGAPPAPDGDWLRPYAPVAVTVPITMAVPGSTEANDARLAALARASRAAYHAWRSSRGVLADPERATLQAHYRRSCAVLDAAIAETSRGG